MALPTSGAISLSQIGYEAKYAYFSTVVIDWEELRRLPNKLGAGSMISFADFRGTAHGVGNGYLANSFTNLTNQMPKTSVWSNVVLVAGLPEGGASAVIEGATYARVNGQYHAPTNVFTAKNGDTIQLQVTVPEAWSMSYKGTTTAKVVFSTGLELPWVVETFKLKLVGLNVSWTPNRSISVSTASSIPTGATYFRFSPSVNIWETSTKYIGAEIYPPEYTTTDDVFSVSGSHSSTSSMADASWWRTFNINIRIRGVTYSRMSLFTGGQVDFWNPQ